MSRPRINVNVSGPQESVTTPKNLVELTEDVSALQASVDRCGTERPELTEEDAGYQFFDKTNGIPIWWNGVKWINATGEDAPDPAPIPEPVLAPSLEEIDNEQTE